MKMFKYYIIDDSNCSLIYNVFKTKKEFMSSMFYNRNVAKYYGDCVPTRKFLVDNFKKYSNYSISLNGFTYIKEKIKKGNL